MEFNQATPNVYQMIALWLCNNMTLSLTEAPTEKKLAGRAGLLPPSCIISGISLISVNSRKLFRAHG